MTDPTQSAIDEVVALEHAYWEAMKAKDGRRSAELSGDPSLVAGKQGVSRIPRAKMGAMTEQGDWVLHDYAFDTVEVTMPAPNVAIVAYKVRETVTMGGKKTTFTAADMSTWVKGDAGWTCHAHSETILDA